MKLNRSWTDKGEHRFLSLQLVESSGPGFRAAVLPLLRSAFHERALTWHPASLPELGEDHILWRSGEEVPLVTVCLAFTGPELGEKEVQRVREAIRRFAGSAVRTGLYLLLHNAESRSREARETIEAELAALASSGRAERAEPWSRQRLLAEAFNGMLRHTWATLQRTNLSTASIEALKSQAAFVPLEEVPCDLSLLLFDQHHLREVTPLRSHELLDPAAAMLDPDGELLTLVTGEFGVGKTTAVARAVVRETRPILYVAGARVSKETVGKKDFLQQCIDHEQLFSGFPAEDRPTLEKLSRPVIEYLLQDPESQTLVVIDGLDESAFLGRRGGFQHLFNILQEVRSPVVLTLRDEFWDQGVESFAAALGLQARHGEPRNRKIRRIDLLAWGDDRIRMLIRRYREGASDPAAQARLEELAGLLDQGELSRLYGDIPGRPLFLRLLLDSVLEEGLPAPGTGRARLLRDWALRKLHRDIQAPVAAGGVGRLPILSEEESEARAVDIAWEAMLQAAAAMVEPVEGSLELAPDCTLEKVRGASPDLGRIEEPLGIFLNSLLLAAGPVPRGLPLRVRFAHRAFQEFFLAWFALIRPGHLPAGPLPDLVRDWMDQIQAEGLLRVAAPVVRHAVPHSQVDLEIRVVWTTDAGSSRLTYHVHSPSGAVDAHYLEVPGPTLYRRPEDFRILLLQKLEKLGTGRDVDGALLLGDEVESKLIGLGRDLYRELFSREMRQVYRRFRQRFSTLTITSDEPWIPWELVRPYDADDPGEIVDDDFLCIDYQMTRWLAGAPAAPEEIPLAALACLAPAQDLPFSLEEKSFLAELSARHGIEDASPAEFPGWRDLDRLLEKDGLPALHFAAHGTFDSAQPDEAAVLLADGRSFRPVDLHGSLQMRIGRDRPLVFLNTCRAAQQSWSLTGLGGWAERWVRVCGCGAFVGPVWTVNDELAFAFAVAFYTALEQGKTFGEAGKEARLHVRHLAPDDPAWLAYSIYARTNGRIRWGG